MRGTDKRSDASRKSVQRKRRASDSAEVPQAGARVAGALPYGRIVQRVRRDDAAGVKQIAGEGLAGPSGPLPHLGVIQASFGGHDVGSVQAHVGGVASSASAAMGASAYASGNHVAFGEAPSLHTAAHEAAHVVQQRAGVELSGGVGKVGDSYEQHADAVADAVVQGKSAEGLLDGQAGGASLAGSVQRSVAVQFDPPEETITFDDDEGMVITGQLDYTPPAGRSGGDVIDNYLANVRTMYLAMGMAHTSGISNFIDTMQTGGRRFDAGVAAAMFKSVGKSLLDNAVSGIAGLVPIPGFSIVVGVVQKAIEAGVKAVEDQTTANRGADLADYFRRVRNDATNFYANAILEISNGRRQIDTAFDALYGTSSFADGSYTYTGDKAQCLRNMYGTRLPAAGNLTTAVFQDAVTSNWATSSTGGGRGTSSSHGRDYSNGTIRIWVDSEDDDGNWTFEVDKAELLTTSHAAQAADLVRDMLSSRRKTLWNCGIPVKVMWHAHNNMPGGWSWYELSGVTGPQTGDTVFGAVYNNAPGMRALMRSASTWRAMELKASTHLEAP